MIYGFNIRLVIKKKHDLYAESGPDTQVTWGDGTNSIYPDEAHPENIHETRFIFA
ncbi:MAG: hypothetical protein GDA53_07155 [Rhodobacteraceae bacterium]|nr:hypothetical protein [Paracoccaceae bacterium]